MSKKTVVTPTAIINRYQATAAPSPDAIPVVDISAVFGDDRSQIMATAEEVKKACSTIGFMYVSGHGIPQSVIDNTIARTQEFFALPEQVKLGYDIGEIKRHRGFVPVGALTADPDKVDIQEGYEVGVELPADDPDYLAGSVLFGPNLWPTEIPEFERDVYRYFTEIRTLGERLFRLFAIALGLPDDYFAPLVTKPTAQLRLLYYPQTDPRSVADGVVGIGAHTDYECFTILSQTEQGLQVQNKAGVWIDAVPIPGTFVINIGDMMQRWTNDLFVSTPHRVVPSTGKARYSFPFFFGANHDVIVECFEQCCSPDNPPRYPPTHFGLWVENMHTYSYVYRHHERGQLANPELTDRP